MGLDAVVELTVEVLAFVEQYFVKKCNSCCRFSMLCNDDDGQNHKAEDFSFDKIDSSAQDLSVISLYLAPSLPSIFAYVTQLIDRNVIILEHLIHYQGDRG